MTTTKTECARCGGHGLSDLAHRDAGKCYVCGAHPARVAGRGTVAGRTQLICTIAAMIKNLDAEGLDVMNEDVNEGYGVSFAARVMGLATAAGPDVVARAESALAARGVSK